MFFHRIRRFSRKRRTTRSIAQPRAAEGKDRLCTPPHSFLLCRGGFEHELAEFPGRRGQAPGRRSSCNSRRSGGATVATTAPFNAAMSANGAGSNAHPAPATTKCKADSRWETSTTVRSDMPCSAARAARTSRPRVPGSPVTNSRVSNSSQDRACDSGSGELGGRAATKSCSPTCSVSSSESGSTAASAKPSSARPETTLSRTAARCSGCTMCRVTSGHTARKRPITGANGSSVNVGRLAMSNRPARIPVTSRTNARPTSNSRSARRADSRNTSPAAVRRIPRGRRWNSSASSSRSRVLIDRDKEGCATCRACAAAVMPPCSTTATKYSI